MLQLGLPSTRRIIDPARGGAAGLAIRKIRARGVMTRVLGSPPEPAGLIEAKRGRANFGTPIFWPGKTGPIATRFINGHERLQPVQRAGKQGGEWRPGSSRRGRTGRR